MATMEQLEQALFGAHNAGDMDAARVLAAAIKKARGDRVSQIPGMPVAGEPPPDPTLAEKVIGTGEAALTIGTGMTGGALGMIGGALKGMAEQILSGKWNTKDAEAFVAQTALKKSAMEGAQALTYAPRTESGQEQAKAAGDALALIPPVLPIAGQIGAATRTAMPAVSATTQAGVRAAGRAGKAIVERVSPEPPVVRAGVGAEAVSPAVVRQEKAAGLPVPVSLTRGAAIRDADQLSFEKEQMKGPLGAPLRARAEQNNLQALQNFDTLIDVTGAVSPDSATVGNTVTKALSKGYDAAKNKTKVAYKAAEKAGELVEPVAYGPIREFIAKQTPTTRDQIAPILRAVDEQLSANDPANTGAISLKALEDVRQVINKNTQFGTPNEKFGVDLKKLIDQATEGKGGELYKKARAERMAQARKFENRAIVARLVHNRRGMDDPQVSVDQVFRKTILNSSPEEITFVKRVLQTTGKDGKEAWKELQGETLKYIRDEATKGMGMDSADNPIVSPAKLHAVVTQLDKNGRLDLMIGKKNGQVVRDLNEVVRYVSTVPPGTLVNTSGTSGMILAAIAEAGINGSLTGLPVPVLTTLKLASKGVKNAGVKARIKKALGE